MQGFLLIDKPEGITSFSAVSKVKRIAKEKRVGHTGTLDPLATGVLPIFLGRATALSGILLEAEKEYTATVKLGVTTDTDDITGNILSEKRVEIKEEELIGVLARFKGEILQIPPIYSTSHIKITFQVSRYNKKALGFYSGSFLILLYND